MPPAKLARQVVGGCLLPPACSQLPVAPAAASALPALLPRRSPAHDAHTPAAVPQIVAVRGFNPTGGRLVARQIITHAPPPAPAAAAAPMDVDGPAQAVAVAAGPFTTADDPAGFAPLEALLSALARRAAPPAMLVLLGPFVDVEQPAVAGGTLDVTFQALFVQQVRTVCARAGAAAAAKLDVPARAAAWRERYWKIQTQR